MEEDGTVEGVRGHTCHEAGECGPPLGGIAMVGEPGGSWEAGYSLENVPGKRYIDYALPRTLKGGRWPGDRGYE